MAVVASRILAPLAAAKDGATSNLFTVSASVERVDTAKGAALVALVFGDTAGCSWRLDGSAWLTPEGCTVEALRQAWFSSFGWTVAACVSMPGRKMGALKVLERGRAALAADFDARGALWAEAVRGAVRDALACAGGSTPDAASAEALAKALAESEALRAELAEARAAASAGNGARPGAESAEVAELRAALAAARAELAELRPAAPVCHEVLPDVLAALDCPEVDAVWLYGPAGTGKTALCEQVAELRGWEYHMVGCVSDVFAELKGFVDANGGRNLTEFTRALDAAAAGRDVLMVFDEIDASIPAVLNSLNGVLSGAAIECAGRVYTRQDLAGRLHVAACANTLGLGGDDMYQRERIDAATLDRFALVEVGYSPAVDALCAGGDAELLAFAQALRGAFSRLGLDALMSYRGIKKLAGLGASLGKVKACRMTFACRLSASDLDSLISALRFELAEGNTWLAALAELRDGAR